MKPTPVASPAEAVASLHPQLAELADSLHLSIDAPEEMRVGPCVNTLPIGEQIKHLSDHLNDVLEEAEHNKRYALRLLSLLPVNPRKPSKNC